MLELVLFYRREGMSRAMQSCEIVNDFCDRETRRKLAFTDAVKVAEYKGILLPFASMGGGELLCMSGVADASFDDRA